MGTILGAWCVHVGRGGYVGGVGVHGGVVCT